MAPRTGPATHRCQEQQVQLLHSDTSGTQLAQCMIQGQADELPRPFSEPRTPSAHGFCSAGTTHLSSNGKRCRNTPQCILSTVLKQLFGTWRTAPCLPGKDAGNMLPYCENDESINAGTAMPAARKEYARKGSARRVCCSPR